MTFDAGNLTLPQLAALRKLRDAGDRGLRLHGSGVQIRVRQRLLAEGLVRVDETFRRIHITQAGIDALTYLDAGRSAQ